MAQEQVLSAFEQAEKEFNKDNINLQTWWQTAEDFDQKWEVFKQVTRSDCLIDYFLELKLLASEPGHFCTLLKYLGRVAKGHEPSAQGDVKSILLAERQGLLLEVLHVDNIGFDYIWQLRETVRDNSGLIIQVYNRCVELAETAHDAVEVWQETTDKTIKVKALEMAFELEKAEGSGLKSI